MKRNIMTAAATFALAIALTSSPASAADTKVYPGNECQPFYGNQAGDFTTGSRSIYNKASSSRLVSCPIVSDNGSVYGDVRVDYKAPSGNTYSTTCFVYNMNTDGNPQSYGASSGVSNGISRNMYLHTNKRSDTYYQTLWCLLPAGSELNYYTTYSYYIY